MGARQSVAQPPRQRTQSSTAGSSNNGTNGTSSSNHLSNSGHGYTNGHAAGDSSTSNGGGNRSSMILQQSFPAPRPRQTRSRSVPMPPPPDGSTSSEPPTDAHRHHNIPSTYFHHNRHHYSTALDQSSDSSGDDGNVLTTASTGISSLDRLLRLNTAVAAAAGSSAGGTWLPPFPFRYVDIKCPVCSKMVPSDDAEYHVVVCMTRPRIAYNEDVLTEDKGECVICFDEMTQGDTIARLPCLCIYHKMCIDCWFKVKNSCPEHPGDD